MMTPKFKKIAALLTAISAIFVDSAHPQAARTVMVNSNTGVLLFPTNLWSANAANARSGLSLGSAATNPASAFQPSSTILSNLASSNGAGLTNLTAANVTGTVALASNVTGTIAISNGGTGATNAAAARANLGLGDTNNVTFSSAVFNGGISINSNEIAWESGPLFDLETRYIYDVWNFQSAPTFANAAGTRTNLGLSANWVTNTNNPVFVSTNGTVVSPTNFWQVAPIQTLVQTITPATNSTNAATNARNLYVYSLATNIVNVLNTITLPTNTSAFDGDEVTIIHRGGSNSVTAVRQLGSTNNLISLDSYDESVKFIKDGNWDFYHNISFTEAIRFSGTNAAANAGASRTNLAIGWPALTNSNSAIQLLGYNTNQEVVYAETNTLTFTNLINVGGVILDSASEGATMTYDSVDGFKFEKPPFMAPTTNFLAFFPHWYPFSSNALGWRIGTATNSSDQLDTLFSFNETGEFWSKLGASLGGEIVFRDSASKAVTRTNLDIPLAALTNTNNATFQQAIFVTNSIPTNSANVNSIGFNTAVAWMEVSIVTNSVTNSYRIPLFK